MPAAASYLLSTCCLHKLPMGVMPRLAIPWGRWGRGLWLVRLPAGSGTSMKGRLQIADASRLPVGGSRGLRQRLQPEWSAATTPWGGAWDR